jgi:hypothetical protein
MIEGEEMMYNTQLEEGKNLAHEAWNDVVY